MTDTLAATQQDHEEVEGVDDSREVVVAISLDFSKRLMEAESLEDLYFRLTNDIQVLMPFDRCFLVTHLGGTSKLVAAGGQPILEKKS
ncbi:hypothetical protein ACFL2Q_14915, partial [Thermodesulfobacteriota bacterium]